MSWRTNRGANGIGFAGSGPARSGSWPKGMRLFSRLAGRQFAANGAFADEKYGTVFTQAGFLEIFARYDAPVARVVLLRAAPWILESQNTDGSWGEAGVEDATTLAVVKVLRRIGHAGVR